jgi:hypothetical protein
MQNRLTMRKPISVLLACLTFGALLAPAADAQNWTYSPFTGQSTWLSFARTLAYPLNRLSGSGTPFYLANNLIYAGTYAVDQHARNRQRDYFYSQYYDQEPYGNPRKRNRAVPNNGYSVNDQIVQAKRMGQQQQQDQDDDQDEVPVTQNFNQDWQGPAPVVGGPGVMGATPGAVAPFIASAPPAVQPVNASALPPVAPAVARSAPRAVSAPLAQGFIHVVNDRFNGDISAALADKDTAKYAGAVGLIEGGKFDVRKISSQKGDLIRAILADENEPADVRINAVRVLLKH